MAYEKYIDGTLGLQQETVGLETPTKVSKKKLYSLLKHSQQDTSGITSLDIHSLISDTDKANPLNQQ